MHYAWDDKLINLVFFFPKDFQYDELGNMIKGKGKNK